MEFNIDAELLRALENDAQLAFKKTAGQYMTGGTCPACGKKELFISTAKPYVLKCNRANQCSYSETTRDRYPELFSNFSKRFPASKQNPKATADAFMRDGRGFPLAVIGNWYTQEKHEPARSGKVFDTVRFYFNTEKTRYWERLIDCNKDDAKQRHNISGTRKKYELNHPDCQEYDGTLYKGECWTPPGQVIADGETVWWVEGIFHAIALHLAGKKVIAAIAANNFPALFLRDYYGKKITWVLALDDDKAGHDYANSHRTKLLAQQQSVKVALTGGALDWDDLYKAGKLDDGFFDECLHRGQLFTADTIQELAWLHYCKNGQFNNVLPFQNRWWGVRTSADNLQNAVNDAGIDITSQEGFDKFKNFTKCERIANCLPEFVYCEQHAITQEINYFFSIDFPHGAPRCQVSLPGSVVESPASFNKAMLQNAAGATFDGDSAQLKRLRERWFNQRPTMVQTAPFVGYDRTSKTYLFQDFAYHHGQLLKPTPHAYFNASKTKIKTTFRGFQVMNCQDFNNAWFNDFVDVFGQNGVVALAFWLGSLFAEQIRHELGHKSFPFLEMTGQHGTGKSTLIEFLWKLLGRDDYEGFDPGKASFAARARAFNQVANMPVVLIESDREETGSKKGAFDFEELKTAYNGRAIRSIGSFTRGNETEEPPFRAAIVIAQNAEVDASPAMLSRIVHLHFTSGNFSEKSKRLVHQFAAGKSENFAGFLHAALRQEKTILETFSRTFLEIEQRFADSAELKDPRVIKTHAQVAALCQCLPLLFPAMTAERCSRMVDYLQGRAQSRQGRMEADHPMVSRFWEIYDLLNVKMPDEAYIEEHLNHSPQANEIAISLTQFLQECAKNRVDADSFADLKKVLPGSRQRKFIGIKTVRSRILKKALRCWVFENKEGAAQ